MRYNPFLVVAATLSAILSTYAVLAIVFPSTTMKIAPHLDGEEAIVLYMALCLILAMVLIYLKINKPYVERILTGRPALKFSHPRSITTYLVIGFISLGFFAQLVEQNKTLYGKIVLASGVLLLLSVVTAVYERVWPSKKPSR